MKARIARWIDPLARLTAALSIAYSYSNDFVGRVQLAFDALAIICLAALAVSIYNVLRNRDDRVSLIAAFVSGGLFYIGKYVIFSVTAWVVYLISPASINSYHIPALVFVIAMVTPWLVDQTGED
ncbi:MAG: hypothetical protein ACRDFQ_09635 [Anaerolineales bacterium]